MTSNIAPRNYRYQARSQRNWSASDDDRQVDQVVGGVIVEPDPHQERKLS
jgi:hypothetical protein